MLKTDSYGMPVLEEVEEKRPLNKNAISRFLKLSGSQQSRESAIDNAFNILKKKKGTSFIVENMSTYLVRGEDMSIHRGIGSSVDEFVSEKSIFFEERKRTLKEDADIQPGYKNDDKNNVGEEQADKKEDQPKKEGMDLLSVLDAFHKDVLSGGEGDQSKPSDFDLKQVLKGIVVELEHTDDGVKALEITLDHLSEDPVYYDNLEKVHKEERFVGTTDPYGIPL